MSRPLHLPRWSVSFADLALLLLGFFVLLHAGNAREVAAGARAAFSDKPAPSALLEARAAALFEPSEARLTFAARARAREIGRRAAAAGRSLEVIGEGRDPAARRFDSWELAAARTAALARAIGEGGLAEDKIQITLPAGRGAEAEKGQTLVVRFGA